MVTLRLLGNASIEEPTGPLRGPAAQRHRLALLALLAASHPGGLSRDKLLAYLWPERSSDRGRNLLNQSLHVLRRALGDKAIRSVGDALRLDPLAVRVDSIQFVEALAADDPELAVRWYRGPFLDGFFLPDAVEFERRVEAERSRLQDKYRTALERLAEAAAGRDRWTEAVRWWRRLATEQPFDSRVTLGLMKALERAGARGEAVRQAGVHALFLEGELGLEPDPAVVTLAERLRTDPSYEVDEPRPGVQEPQGPGPEAAASAPASDHRRSGGGGSGHPPGQGRRWGARLFAVAALLAIGIWALMTPFFGDSGSDTPEIRRVAVLPFANLTGDEGQEYFVAGMHDMLVAELGRVADLPVLSRQSVLRYRDSDEPLAEIARTLGVDALVSGAVLVVGDSVSVTAQLIRAAPEELLWADVYRGGLGEALALQGEVAQSIARAVHAGATPGERVRAARGRTLEPRAQEAYLNGLYHLELQGLMLADASPEILATLRTAIRYLEEAVTLDPEWATAHAKLALAYHWLATRFRVAHAEEFFPKSKAAALRSLELDGAEPQAHASLGYVLYQYEWDWRGAETSIRRAMELDPNSHHHVYALFLQAAGRHDEAIAHFRLAEERNPLSEVIKHQLAGALRCAGRHDEAIAQLRELEARIGADSRPDQVAWLGHSLGRAYSGKSMHAEAVAELERAVVLSDSVPLAVVGLAEMYAHTGRLEEARALLAGLEERKGGPIGRPAQLLAALGETDRAVIMIEEAFRDASGKGGLTNFRCTETYRLLADEPGIRAIVERISYPN